MSYFEDYVEDGLCCESCGEFLGDEPGFVRRCGGCSDPIPPIADSPDRKLRRRSKKNRTTS